MRKLICSALVLTIMFTQLVGLGVVNAEDSYTYDGDMECIVDMSGFTSETSSYTSDLFLTDLDWIEFIGTLVFSYDMYVPAYDTDMTTKIIDTVLDGANTKLRFYKTACYIQIKFQRGDKLFEHSRQNR